MPQPVSLLSPANPIQLTTKVCRFWGSFCLWSAFFLICFGLGYPTLNRYDERKALPDAARYAKLATDGPAVVDGNFRFRVLVPLLAKQVYRLAAGHAGGWDALAFAFLIVNSVFVATTAYLLFAIGVEHLVSRSTALLGAALYLLNFAVANAQLAGLVDAGEACFLMAVVASMFYRRWATLPIIGVFGAITKESFIPFSIAMAATWWIVSRNRTERARSAPWWLVAMIVSEIVSITLLHFAISERTGGLWNFALSLNSNSNYSANLLRSLVDRSSWYILIWLLPLGLMRIRQFRREWVWAAIAGTSTALVLNAYHSTVGGGGGGIDVTFSMSRARCSVFRRQLS